MNREEAARATTLAGGVTAVIGSALVLAPDRVGPLADLEIAEARAIGLVDLSLVPGLLAGRPRWPWMAARTTANLGTAAYLGSAGRTRGSAKLLAIAAALVAITVVDSQAAVSLRNSGD